MAVQHNAANTYKDENGSGYWNDLIEIHYALGLSVRLGDAVAISPLVSSSVTSIPARDFNFQACINAFYLYSLCVN
jgi:hypothetical protein